MLHIIFFILKLIGYLILAVLGLTLLILFLILFSPIRYKVQASGCGTLESVEAHATFSWLLYIFAGSADYQNKTLNWKMRAAWKKFPSSDSADDMAVDDSTYIDSIDEPSEEPSAGESVPEKISVSEPERIETVKSDEEKISEPDERHTAEKDPKEKEPKEKEPKEKKQKSKKEKTAKNIEEQDFSDTSEKPDGIIAKIKYTFNHICDMMKSLMEKKEHLTDFLTDDVHKAAFDKVLKPLIKFLKRLCPKVLYGKIHYGFEDPATTGQVLAGVSMVYPFISDHLDIWPDFEEEIVEGNVTVKGNIRLIHLIVFLVVCVIDKNVRVTYKDFKEFKL